MLHVQITSSQPNLTVEMIQDFLCIRYSQGYSLMGFFYDFSFFKRSVHYRSLDDAFPVVTLHFEKELQLKVYPHDYLFSYKVIIFFSDHLFLCNLNIYSIIFLGRKISSASGGRTAACSLRTRRICFFWEACDLTYLPSIVHPPQT